MKPAAFDLHRPTSVADAVALLAAHGDEAKVLAGGQSLVPLLSLRLATPAHLVDVGGVLGLGEVTRTATGLRVGAMVSHRRAGRDPGVAAGAPLLARAVPLVGHAAIRSRGTVGGAIAHADPAAEYPAVCVALGAELEVVGPAGTRLVPARAFFVSTYTTALAADELLVAVHLPVAGPRHGAAVEEVARRHGDFALAGAACVVELDGTGRVERAGLALFGVADRPWPADAAVVALTGAGPDVDVDAVARLAVTDLHPADTLHATGRYLRHVAGVVAARAIGRALDEARRG